MNKQKTKQQINKQTKTTLNGILWVNEMGQQVKVFVSKF